MDSCLTQKVPVSLPGWKLTPPPSIKGYHSITSLLPILEKFYGENKPKEEGQLAADERFVQFLEFQGNGECLIETTKKKKRKTFCKVLHLLDPIRTLQSYYEHPVKGSERRKRKLENPMNQAYVDGLANYLVGQLTERNISPHFCLSFGSYRGIAELYRFNITDEFESYRKYKAFWDRKRAGVFNLYMNRSNKEKDGYTDEELEGLLHTPKSSLRSSYFSYKTPTSAHSSINSSISYEDAGELLNEPLAESLVELEEVQPSFSETYNENLELPMEEESIETESEDEDESGIEMYAEFKEYPVLLIFQERMEGVLDTMLEDEELVGALEGTDEWELRWTAWIFQIIAALCAAQGALGFTHNDLHTNNIVWSNTDIEYLYYIARDGTVWKIPTYGKLLKLIDFGRGIYRVGDTWFLSDDYDVGGDAEGQYNCFSLVKPGSNEPLMYPNPSFDLCRFSVSSIECLFSTKPDELPDGRVLSQESDWTVRETKSELWNLLWSWLIKDDGSNVLHDKDGVERYPDFDLYKEITSHVHGAKPQDQLRKNIFEKFIVSRTSVKEGVQLYPLFT